MKIAYFDKGAAATMVITSTVFEFRQHNRVVDTVRFLHPDVIATRSGLFRLKTVVSGKALEMLRAHRTVQRETSR